MTKDEDCPVNMWVNVVRRARLGPTAKLVAMVLASYADANGSHVFPGVRRVAVHCEIAYSTTRRALRQLRDAGLIEMTGRGNRRAGKSDEYRLILAEDLLDRVHVPTPDEERKSMAEINMRKCNQGSLASPNEVGPRSPPDRYQGSRASPKTVIRAR